MNLNSIAILNIKGSDYCCIISIIIKMRSKMQNPDLVEKKWNVIKPNARNHFETKNLLQILV